MRATDAHHSVLDDDVLAAAKAITRQQGRSLGEVVSEFAARGSAPRQPGAERNGAPLMTVRNGQPPVTLETVNALRDELP